MPKVIYLTGAPAAGKSTTAKHLARMRSDVHVFEYGAELTKLVGKRVASGLLQDELRQKSSLVVKESDVRELDEALVSLVNGQNDKHVIINSHPVTKELYGFRITPFEIGQIKRLRIYEIWVLYASAAVTINRIVADPGGRPTPTREEAEMHTNLQSSLAAMYAVVAGVPAYLFDTSQDRETLYRMLSSHLDRS